MKRDEGKKDRSGTDSNRTRRGVVNDERIWRFGLVVAGGLVLTSLALQFMILGAAGKSPDPLWSVLLVFVLLVVLLAGQGDDRSNGERTS